MQDLEQKRKRVETIAKIAGLGVLCLVLGPVYLTLLHGITALAALTGCAAGGFVIINFIPAFARLVGNWRLKALKAVAAANPIENLEMIYNEKQQALAASRENINQTYAILKSIYDQIQDHDNQFPGKPSQYLEKYQKLKALIEMRGAKYKQAKANLDQFSTVIDEKRSDWKIAQAMAQANKLANVGEDFETKLMQDTALSTVQDGLNNAFAELDTALLDAPDTGATVTVSAAPAPKSITNSTVELPEMNLDQGEVKDSPSPVRRRR